MSNNKECKTPHFSESQYNRGPTDKNSSMFSFEKKMVDQIEARVGKPGPDNAGMPTDGKRQSFPGK